MRGPFSMEQVLSDVMVELDRARNLHPRQDGLPDGTGGAARKTWEEMSRNACDRATREGQLTHAHIFEEEASEALNATDQAHLRQELLEVIAVSLRWIEDIDNRVTG